MTLSEIPDEMFMHICRYIAKDATLAALKSTCWRFHRLLEDSTFWRESRLAIHGVLKVGFVSRALNSAPCLLQLDLRDCLQVITAMSYLRLSKSYIYPGDVLMCIRGARARACVCACCVYVCACVGACVCEWVCM